MFRCKKCIDELYPTDSLNSIQVHVGEDIFEAVPTFQSLGDVMEESGGCLDSTSARITAAWKGFRQLLPIITNRGISLRNRVNIFSSCIRKSQLYGCKTWPTSSKIIHCLTSADNAIVRWICGDRLEQHIRTQEHHEKLGIISAPEEIRWRRLRMDRRIVWPRRVNDYMLPQILSRGRLQLRWSDVIIKKTSKILPSGKNVLANGQNGEGQLCQEKCNCKEFDPPSDPAL